MEFTWKIDKRSRFNGLRNFDLHMENKHIMCIIDKMAILSIMVARFDFFFDKMGKMTKTLSDCWGLFLVPILVPKIHDYVILRVLFLIKNIDLLRILRVLKNTF
ncbi:hypothetical protein JXX17_07255 [Streptococcus suis]|uniref:hypothetical protein n=1 Tax=Streptococcus suis TaxID=1307 RepID=UPI0029C23C5E|nr:hypothetical protein [Streptococcus suis]MCB2910507.1 hypothetical protein [Streptococcus suis]MDX5052614.1 hypothetical protein [Streptococcus suis]HEL1819983.1 hypothetical protein [Streptococcus suis]